MNFLKTRISFWISVLLGFLLLIVAFANLDSKFFTSLILLSLSLFFLADIREKEKFSLLISILLLVFSLILFLITYF